MTIVITLPHFIPDEAWHISQFLKGQVDRIHIRKPDATAEEIERLVREIPSWCYGRIVLHDHHELAVKYSLGGVHLNRRNPRPPEGWKGSVSRSCHSLAEVAEWKRKCDYVSLSPVFDSISKEGYRAAFSPEELGEARAAGVIDGKVLALGGVTFSRVDDVMRMGFGGGMILGDAWKNLSAGQTAVAMTIAGSDSSAGAGIQQDLKTMEALGVYCATVITAVTSQNTFGITHVKSLAADVVESQMAAVLGDFNVRAVKIGMIPDAGVARVIAATIKDYKTRRPCHVVYDPVMVSTSGRKLMADDCLRVVVEELMPLCSLVTPNIPEAECISEVLGCQNSGQAMARVLHTAILVKGGHAGGDMLCDRLYMPDGSTLCFETERIPSRNLHGTGCTLSSAIAANMLAEPDWRQAISKAKEFVSLAIERGRNAKIGTGNGPLLP